MPKMEALERSNPFGPVTSSRDPSRCHDILRARTRKPAPKRSPLISDGDDDYEMSDDFAKMWIRVGDRLAGFVLGFAVLAAAWTIWFLV